MLLSQQYNYVTQDDYESVAGPDWPTFEQFQAHNNIEQFVYDEIDQMLQPSEKFNHPAFCVLPFFGLELGTTQTACCLLPAGADIEKIRTGMLSGNRPHECAKCWRNEDANILSDRQIKNKTLSFLKNTTIQNLLDQCEQNQHSVSMLKIDTSNTCNATCVTCDSSFSSAWGALEQKNNIIPAKNWKIKIEDFNHSLDYSHLSAVSFRGGEPFLSSTNFDILNKILQNNNNNCFISFVTNGSFKLNSEQKHILSQFNNVNFCFSIDGIGPVFEYLRYPLKWNNISDNILWAKNNNIDVSVSYTVSNVNLWYYSETVDWFRRHDINFLVNSVYDPTHFQPASLPLQLKNTIISNRIAGCSELSNILGTHSIQDEINYKQFLIEIQKQDSWKGISITDYLPEFAKHLALDQ
jgi:sulfatase maturation enzyme AslB (radical SAM superfamily)